MNMVKKKILFVVSNISITNGVSSFLFNYLKKMNLNNFKITILTSDYCPEQNYIEFCKEHDICLEFLPLISRDGLCKYLKSLKLFFKNNHDFDIVYSNVANQAYFIFKLAKKYGIKVRAIHAHATKSSDSIIHRIRNFFVNKAMLRYSTHKFACGQLAGNALFGKKSQFTVINNAIDYSKFGYSVENRNEIRQKLNLNKNNILLGFIGRFVPQKNIYFFIEILKGLSDDYKLLMIGEGPQKEEFIKKCDAECVLDRIIFISETNQVYKYYSAMDIFCLPSLFEGLPVVGVEAQVNGLQCIFSDNITRECMILPKTKFCNLNSKIWIDTISQLDNNHDSAKLGNQYDINVQSKIFENILMGL